MSKGSCVATESTKCDFATPKEYRVMAWAELLLLYTRKLDTSCQAMRQEVMLAKFQPHASQMHFKWAEIRYCTQYAVYSNLLLLLIHKKINYLLRFLK